MWYRTDIKASALLHVLSPKARFGTIASQLDREADLQLALGRHLAAERLSRQAEELRESAR
jgi:hypothetical protein